MDRNKTLAIGFCMVSLTFLLLVACSSEKDNPPAQKDTPKVEISDKTLPAEQVQPSKEPALSQMEEDELDEMEGPANEPEVALPPAVIVLQPKLWKELTKPSVPFTHEKHVEDYEIECAECHHNYKDGKNVWNKSMPVETCDTCHTNPATKELSKLSDEEKVKNLEMAFHNNCRECHKKRKKESPDSEIPVKCNQCHQKEE